MTGISMAPVVYISVDWDYFIVLLCCFIHCINKENKVVFFCFGFFLKLCGSETDYDTNLIMPFLCMADLYASEE